jgi:ribosomal protein S12 methylthiotransferase
VESVDDETVSGRAAHQGPEVDGLTHLLRRGPQVGDMVRAVVIDSEGVDLHAREVR